MIIDVHGHLCASPKLYAWYTLLLASRATYGTPPPPMSDDEMLSLPETKRNLDAIDLAGTDVQLLSPRPFTMFHAEKPGRVAHRWNEGVNAYIAQFCRVLPDRFAGICGLPQPAGEPIQTSLPELERCIKEYGFVGCLLDPDPGEGDNQTPALGDEYWYPLYEKLCELDVPAHVHSTGNQHGRGTYSTHFIDEESLAILSLVNSRVFLDFPKLKIIISHGGGSVPYQVGRWRAERLHPVMAKNHPLNESLRRKPAADLLRHGDPLQGLAGDADQAGRQRPRRLRYREPRLGHGDESGDRPQLRRHQGAGRGHRLR